jgi:putative membrane protein
MKNILTICRNDLRRIASSVVAIVIILGLAAVPCLYAWFNIFSNWDPYGTDSTSRIKVAVASEDAGASVLGLKLNVGSSVVSALEANDSIGWQFVDTKQDALDLVYSGDCYAALVIPEDFTTNVTSFLSGDITNPEIIFYQNDKKNAIAPKITEKAKTAVQEQVNSTFVQTIADDIASLISVANANGVSAESLLNSLSEDIDELSTKLSDCCAALSAANGLTNSARNLISVSVNLCNSTTSTLEQSKELLNKTDDDTATISSRIDSTVTSVTTALAQADADLAAIQTSLESAFSDINRYNDYVSTGLSADVAMLDSLSTNCSDMAQSFTSIGFDAAAEQMNTLASKLKNLSSALGSLKEANDDSWDGIREQQDSLIDSVSSARETISSLSTSVSSDLAPKLKSALSNAQGASSTVTNVLSKLQSSTSALSGTLNTYLGSIGTMQTGFSETEKAIEGAQAELKVVSEFVSALAGSKLLAEVSDTLENNGDLVGGYLASPISMDTVVKYKIETYGSAMSPFYTVLAQWVGALLCAVFLKVKIRAEDTPANLRLHERFFGRYGLFFLVAIGQALIVSLGDLWYVQIQCLYPWRFVLAAVVTGLCFSLINYALVFALDNIGMALSVIVMVIQVAGSGGTYPVEVLPDIFQKLYDFMPFKYAMNAMRETIAGMYGNNYLHDIIVLLCIALGSIILGLALYYPCLGLNRLIESSKRKSEILQ